MKVVKLSDLADIIGGQIMTRVKADNPNEIVVDTRKVIIPKAIEDTGIINSELLAEENLKSIVDPKKLAYSGDLVIKLNSPYDCGQVDEESRGAVVPSFCAIIRVKESIATKELIPEYLLAFMNSTSCKSQLERYVQSAVMSILSVGKIKEINVPIPSITKQHAIGMGYLETQTKLGLMQQIIKLEKMKNDAIFRELEEL